MNTESIDYNNFAPSIGLTTLAQDLYRQVCLRAPQFSTVRFRVEKKGGIYSAYGTIDTSRGVYVGYSSGQDPVSTVQDMGSQLESRLTLVQRGRNENQYKRVG